MSAAGIVPTGHDKIMVLRNRGALVNGLTYTSLDGMLKDLYALADGHDADGIRLKLKEIVSEYTPQFLQEKTFLHTHQSSLRPIIRNGMNVRIHTC